MLATMSFIDKKTMDNLSIRPLRCEDESDWRQLWTLYLDYYKTSVAEVVYQTTWQRLLSGANYEYCGFMAFQGDCAVGLAHYLFHRHCWSTENVCYLQDLMVHADWRGQGIGRALMEAVFAAADAESCPKVYWLTQHSNEAGRRLYDRVGTLTPFIRYDRRS